MRMNTPDFSADNEPKIELEEFKKCLASLESSTLSQDTDNTNVFYLEYAEREVATISLIDGLCVIKRNTTEDPKLVIKCYSIEHLRKYVAQLLIHQKSQSESETAQIARPDQSHSPVDSKYLHNQQNRGAKHKNEFRSSIEKSNYYGLFIGVEKYVDDNIRNLSYPISDAKILKNVLCQRYSFHYRDINIIENPNRARIINVLEWQAMKVKPEDHLLIYFGGHGIWDDSRKQGYWKPSDASSISRDKWISNSDVKDLLRGFKCRHILLLSDACFGGSILRSAMDLNLYSNNHAVEKLYKRPSRIAMTSGTMEDVPDKSVFIEYLINVLQSSNSDFITSSTLYDQLRISVLNNSPNTPQYGVIQDTGHEGGDFIFLLQEKGKNYIVESEVSEIVLSLKTEYDSSSTDSHLQYMIKKVDQLLDKYSEQPKLIRLREDMMGIIYERNRYKLWDVTFEVIKAILSALFSMLASPYRMINHFSTGGTYPYFTSDSAAFYNFLFKVILSISIFLVMAFLIFGSDTILEVLSSFFTE